MKHEEVREGMQVVWAQNRTGRVLWAPKVAPPPWRGRVFVVFPHDRVRLWVLPRFLTAAH